MSQPRSKAKKYHMNRKKNKSTKPVISKEYRHQNQLTEAEVGITEFINKSQGFSGIIKARYSDFHVNEINLDGEVAKLTDTSYPKFSTKMMECNYQEVEITPSPFIPQETWLAMKKLASAETGDPIYLNVDEITKDDRKEIHECIRRHFGKKIISNTTNKNKSTGKQIEIKKFNKDDESERHIWPQDKGEYVYFLVCKAMMDTVETSFLIAKCFNMNSSNFSYAGVKDRRGITTQWFCVRKVEPWKLLSRTKKLHNIKLGNISFKDKPLKLGQLKGNKFRIALRNVTAVDDLIAESIMKVKEFGFVNYFGLQRFGNDKETPTFEIGIKLLQGRWQEAVDLILKPKESDDPMGRYGDVVKAKKVYAETKDAEKAEAQIDASRNKCIEAKLLEGLKKSAKNDYVNALEMVPRTMRLLYMHSFQSLIWNRMVSKRLQLFGREPVEGDLVLISDNNDVEMSDEEINEEAHEEKSGDKPKTIKVKTLTAPDLGNYTIYDIVLPTPGYDVTYPENMKQYYKEALEELELSLNMPKQKTKTYTLSGNYRHVIGKVQDLSWKITYYEEPHSDLIKSDFEELKGHPDKKNVDHGKYKAVIMEMALPPCSYATMVLREIMKTDTSTSAQAKLNDYHEIPQGNKIIITSSNQNPDVTEGIGVNQFSSLLTDPAKYAEFQSSIFNNTSESVKRKTDEEEDHCDKKAKLEDDNRDSFDKHSVEDVTIDSNMK